MFSNYLKIAWRNISKNRTFSVINAIGLSLSVAFCLLLYFYIRHEQSFDAFHQNKKQLYRLEMSDTFPVIDSAKSSFWSFFTKTDDVKNQLVFPLVVAANMQSAFPEIKNIIRFADAQEQPLKINGRVYKTRHFLYADPTFFTSLSFPLIKGNSKAALQGIQDVVLSASMAGKIFGHENPVGKTIELTDDSTRTYMVSGIARDAPKNSSIQFDVVVPIKSDPGYREKMESGFNSAGHLHLVELNDGINLKNFERKFDKWVQTYYTKPFISEYKKNYTNYDFKNFHWYLRPLTEAHSNTSSGWGHYTDSKKMYQLACLAFIVLAIAALNYVLLVVANAASRAQEIGVRKVLGAARMSVILQFWTETFLITLSAVIVGFLLANLTLPLFNRLMDVDVSLQDFSFVDISFSLLTLALLLSILAGYYPALLLSRMKPVSIVKSFQTFKVNPRFSKILVVVQYTSCVVLMIAAFVIYKQLQFINSKDLGFDKDQVLMVKNPTWDKTFTSRLRSRLKVFAKGQPSILQFSGMNGGLTGGNNTNGFMLNGEQKWLRQLTVDYNYFDMLGVKFLEGRPFSESFQTDTSTAVRPSIVNQTLFKLLGKGAKLGVYNEAIRSTIIGVVKDYNFESLSKKIEPQQHVLAKGYEEYFLFKVKGGTMRNTIASIKEEWKEIGENYPLEYTFLDQSIADMYLADMRWQKIIQATCFFAIFIACMGLFGLSAVNAANRTKEIGIRKVLGATVRDIVLGLTSKFAGMFIVAILIAIPLAYAAMKEWLQDFAYRIELSWSIFFITGMLALCIAFLTISFQAVKAAIANPVKSLRSE